MPSRIVGRPARELIPIPLSELRQLEIREPFLAPVCRRLREIAALGVHDSTAARPLLEYIAQSLPEAEAAFWRDLLRKQPT